VIGVGSKRAHAYPEEEVDFLRLLADQMALVIDAAVNLYSSTQAQDRLRLILELPTKLSPTWSSTTFCRRSRALFAESCTVMLPLSCCRMRRATICEYIPSISRTTKGFFVEGIEIPIEGSMPGETFRTGKPFVVNRLDPAEIPLEMYAKASGEGINSFCDIGLASRNRLLGVMALARREENTFDEDEVAFLTQVAHQVAIAMENALAYGEIAELKDKLARRSCTWKTKSAAKWISKEL